MMDNSGGNNNAYTSNDVTVYTDWFPSSALELMFDMEADRIRDLAFDPKIIESERGVVYSERRSSVDNSNARDAARTGVCDGIHCAPVSLAGGRLAVGHRSVVDGRSEDALPDGLRAE